MHLLFTQFTVRWVALVTGAAHTTAALRAMAREAPLPDDPDDADADWRLPDAQPPLRTLPAAPSARVRPA